MAGAAVSQSREAAEGLRVEHLAGFGEVLKELRWRARMKQVDVCRATGMTAPQVSRYENGHEMPTVESLVKYLAAVGADLCDLQAVLAGKAVPPPEEGVDSPVSRKIGRGRGLSGEGGLGQVLGGLVGFAMESLERFEELEERMRVLEEELAGLKD